MGMAEANRSIDLRAAYAAAQTMVEYLGMSELFGSVTFKIVAGKVVNLDVSQKWRPSDLERSQAS
jgi:hypothetical protein